MDTSVVDEAKNAYFFALLNMHSEEFVCTKSYDSSVIVLFMKFLFEQRTLLAASLINLQREGNTLKQEE